MKSLKKLLAVVMVTILCALTLTACGGETRKCDECGKEAVCEKVEILGQEGWLCKDCKEVFDNSLGAVADLAEGLSNLF